MTSARCRTKSKVERIGRPRARDAVEDRRLIRQKLPGRLKLQGVHGD
jgi:hypothetical protein